MSTPTWWKTSGCSTTSAFFWFFQQVQQESVMSGKTDVAKGRIKEAAGALTGNDKLRVEGKADQAVGKVKEVAGKAVDKVKKAVKELRD